MNTTQDDGGPAFPYGEKNITERYSEGMSLRDWFAGMAMQSLIIDPERVDQSRRECARLSYAMADAMLAARK